MRISLVDRALADKAGFDFRIEQDIEQLGLTYGQCTDGPPEGFKDWGIVTFESVEYYMSSYTPPPVPDDDE